MPYTLNRLARRISLTPCFSWGNIDSGKIGTVSTVSTGCGKPLKRFLLWLHSHTQLKQGVNETSFGLRWMCVEIWGLAVLLSLAFAPLALCQPLTITTLAGYPGQGSADGTGPAARFANPWGVATDTAGTLYVADTDNHTIRKVTVAGVVSTLAGTAGVSGSADGTNGTARFFQPQGLAVDGTGNIYIADTGNFTIRKVTPAGVVTTLAGLAGNAGTNDATGTSARFYEPEAVAVNAAGTLIYVADTWNHTIRQVLSAGVVTTFAGAPGSFGTNDGSGSSARFNQPQGIAVDAAGNVYVSDTGNETIRKISPAGAVTTLAGSAGNYGTNDGTGSAALFWEPQGLALDGAANIYLADSLNATIRKVTPAGVVTTLAGGAGNFGSADGTGATAHFWQPQSVAVDASTNVYVADSANGTIRKIVPGTAVTTLAGSASTGSGDGAGSNARFFWPAGAAIDNNGNSYVADTENSTIRTINPAGVVSTLAGVAGISGTNDGSGSNARFYGPQGVAADTSGNVYVADTANHTIRKISSGRVVSTLAGQAGTNGLTDGTGVNARFNGPQALTVDTSGNVYVADTWNHTIRKVTTAGVVTTLAGLPGYYGDSDGAGNSVGTNTARFYAPAGIAVDIPGNVYVADTRNHAIRKVTSAGVVSTLAGQPGIWGKADGTNSAARFYQPEGITVDAGGNLYVMDSGNHTVRKVGPVGTNWVVTTVAGLATVSGSADGSGANAQFCFPAGIGINNVGSLCVADLGNNTIRTGIVSSNASPSISVQPQGQTVSQGQSPSFSVLASGSAPLAYQWLFYGTNLPTATASSYTVTNAQPSNAGPYSVIVSNTYGMATSSVATLTVIVPPTITNQPQSQTVDQGTSASFSVSASGTTPFAYQWLFNGTNIAAATASSYTRTNAQPADGGNYSVTVSNSAGSVTSSPAMLTVNQVPTPPSISSQPQNQIVSQSSNATFNVTAAGSTPFSYQWLFNSTNLAGATASSYTRTNAQPVQAGPYSVIVTNAYGMATSSVATLTVIIPPIISVQPASQLASVSNSVSFTVGLSQGTSPAYQWRQNGTPISGATQSSLSLTSLLWSNAGTYSVVVSNMAGSQTSSNATLVVQQAVFSFFDGFESYQLGSVDNNTVGSPNTSASNPWWALNTTSARGVVTNASSGVAPHGGSQLLGTAGTVRQDYLNLLYRMNAGQVYYGNFLLEWWFYDPFGTNSSGATNSQDYIALCEDVPVSTTSDSSSSFTSINQRMSLGVYNGNVGYNYSNYQARIIGGAGTFGSQNSWYNTATIRSIGWHHARVVVGIPNATNSAPISMYIDNMTNATVTSPVCGTNGFNIIELNHDMNVAAGAGWYYDDLTFRAANDPWIVEQPVSQGVNLGQSANFTTVAVGTAYQWQFNGNNISGATTSAYSIASVAATNAGNYACVITGTNGNITTSPAALTVTGAPSIVAQPSSLTVTQTQTATFSVTAVGTTPLSCQWLFNSAPISGATATNYIVTDAQATNGGGYSVVVTNSLGGATSSVATLTVLVPVTITNQPQSLTVNQGTDAPFSVSVSGTAPFAYQWLFNSGAISTATASSYTATNSQSTNAGSYSVVVSNLLGTATSTVAILTVIVPPTITNQPASQTVLQGTCATFTVAASGTAPLYYQWQWNSTIFPPDTTSTSFTACNAGSYSVLVSNLAGVALSDTVTLSFTNPPPAQPGHFDSLSLLTGGSLQLNMSGTPYSNYVLEITGNLMNWAPLTTLSGSNGFFQFTDPSPTTNAVRFYRLRVGP